jgi:hypothetical protein
MLTGARKVAEKSAGTSGAFADVAAKLKNSVSANKFCNPLRLFMIGMFQVPFEFAREEIQC